MVPNKAQSKDTTQSEKGDVADATEEEDDEQRCFLLLNDILAPGDEARGRREDEAIERLVVKLRGQGVRIVRETQEGSRPGVASPLVHLNAVLSAIHAGRSEQRALEPVSDLVASWLPRIREGLGADLVAVWARDHQYRLLERLACVGTSGEEPHLEIDEDTRQDLLPILNLSGTLRTGVAELVLSEAPPGVLASCGSRLFAPLRLGDLRLGVLEVVLAHSATGNVEDLEAWVGVVATALASGIREAVSERDALAQRRLAQLANRYDDALAFARATVNELLPSVFRAQAVSLFLVDDAADELILAFSTGLEGGAAEQPRYRRAEGLTGFVWDQAQALRTPDATRADLLARRYSSPPKPRFVSRELLPEGVRRQLLAVPVAQGAKNVVGVLRISGKADDYLFTELDEQLAVNLAGQIAQAFLHTRKLQEKAQRTQTLATTMVALKTARSELEMVRISLAAITCGQGIGFNRAVYFRFDPHRRTLSPFHSVGALDGAEALRIWRGTKNLSFEAMLQEIHTSDRTADQPFANAVSRLEVPQVDASLDPLSRACLGGDGVNVTIQVALLDRVTPVNRMLFELFGAGEIIVVPVSGAGVALGCILADNAFNHHSISCEEVEQLLLHARHLGAAISGFRDGRARDLQTRFDRYVAAALRAPNDDATRKLLSAVCEVLELEAAMLCYYDNHRLRFLGAHGFDDGLPLSLALKVAQEGRPRFARLARDIKDEGVDGSEGWPVPLLAFPLSVGHATTGVLVVHDSGLDEDTEGLIRHVQDTLAAAVQQLVQLTQLRAQGRALQLLTEVFSLLREARDEQTFATRLAHNLKDIFEAQLCSVFRPAKTGDQRLETPTVFERRGSVGYPVERRSAVYYPSRGDRQGLTNHVLSGERVHAFDVRKDPRWGGSDAPYLAFADRLRAFLGVPLRDSRGIVMGAITLTRVSAAAVDDPAFQAEEWIQLEAIADAVARVLELEDAYEALGSWRRRVDMVSRFGRKLTSATLDRNKHLDQVLQDLVDDARQELGADLVTLYEWCGRSDWRGASVRILSGNFSARARIFGRVVKSRVFDSIAGEGIARWCTDARDLYATDELSTDSFLVREQVKSAAALPMRVNNRVIGLLFLSYRNSRVFTPEEKATVETVAAFAALALQAATPRTDSTAEIASNPATSHTWVS